MTARALAALALVAMLAACSSPQQQRISREARMAERVLEREGSIGDPGRVAAADIAFAKMAREQGTWTAFRQYAADDAVMDAPDGFVSASKWLAGRADPAEPLRWVPTDVWASCDGTLAVSQGRFQRSNGLVGDYITVWELQRDGSYKWIYDTGTPDDPQPAPRREVEIPEGENVIVVEDMASITGRVADCASGETISSRPISGAGGALMAGYSDDRSIVWHSVVAEDGSRTVAVEYRRDGQWQGVAELAIPVPSADAQ